MFTYIAYDIPVMLISKTPTPLELRTVNKDLGRLMYIIHHWNFKLKTFEPFSCFPTYKEARTYCDKIYESSHLEPLTEPSEMDIN